MKPTKIVIGSIALAGALALTACQGGGTPGTTTTPTASETATATPTPTSTTVAAPTSQDQALKDGLEAVRKYGAAMEEYTRTKSTDAGRFNSLAKGPALDFAKKWVAAAAKDQTKYTGSTTMTLKDGYASELTAGDQKFEFGAVDLAVCEDTSEVKGVNPDGTPAKRPDIDRVIYNYWAEYSPATTSWLVTKYYQDEVIPC